MGTRNKKRTIDDVKKNINDRNEKRTIVGVLYVICFHTISYGVLG